MPTPNFNLPLIDGASPISIVNDMNSLATAVDGSMATLATQGDISSVRQLANSANEAATNATTKATEAASAAEDATNAATTATATATAAASTATTASANATSAKNTAEDTAADVAAGKPTLLWSGVVTPGSTITVPGISNWRMVGVGMSGSTSDGTTEEFVAPGVILPGIASNQLKGGGTWGNGVAELRVYGYAATVSGNSVTFTSNVYFTAYDAVNNFRANRNVLAIYGLIKN